MNKIRTGQNKAIPPIMLGSTVFLASVCLMMLELSAGRIAARQFGASLYTWTSVIGVTLTGLTVGYYTGGCLADSFQLKRTLGVLLAACSAACVLAVVLKNLTADWDFLWRFGAAAKVLIYITVILFTPAALIGAVSPIAVKMALEPGQQHKGRVVGRMYALGAAGSILGTFLAGYWLIAAIGTANTVWVVAAVMLAGAFIYLPRVPAALAYIALTGFLITSATVNTHWAKRLGSSLALRQTPDPDILYEKESQYCYLAVRQASKTPDERHFIEDNLPNHSRLIMGKIRDLRLFYTQAFGEITQRAAKGRDKLCILSIGGGGYVFPRYILDYWPQSRVDVVEIDPAVTEAAKSAFGLSPDTPINTIWLDGRNYVDELLDKQRRGLETPRYDLVYMDAFADVSVPFQLVTRQFNEKIFEIMADDGVYIINMIDLFESAKFLAGFVNTIKQTFPYVYVLPKPPREDLPHNFIIAAGKRELNLDNIENLEYSDAFKAKILDGNDFAALEQKKGWTILDDDFAPVENLLAPVVRRKSQQAAALRFIGKADEFYTSGRWQKAVAQYRKAISACPTMAAETYRMMAAILAENAGFAEAADALRNALAQNPAKIDNETRANVHYRLGDALNHLGQPQEASQHFAAAIEILKTQINNEGNSPETFWQLGQVESTRGNLSQAVGYFEMALAEDPNKIDYHFSLVKALADQKKFDEALRRLDQGIQYMQNAGRNLDAEKLRKMRRRLEIENQK